MNSLSLQIQVFLYLPGLLWHAWFRVGSCSIRLGEECWRLQFRWTSFATDASTSDSRIQFQLTGWGWNYCSQLSPARLCPQLVYFNSSHLAIFNPFQIPTISNRVHCNPGRTAAFLWSSTKSSFLCCDVCQRQMAYWRCARRGWLGGWSHLGARLQVKHKKS